MEEAPKPQFTMEQNIKSISWKLKLLIDEVANIKQMINRLLAENDGAFKDIPF